MQLLKQARIVGKDDEMMAEGEDNEIFELTKFIWNINAYKQTLTDFSLDVEKIPIGVLQSDKVKKCNSILTAITRILSESGGNQAARE